MPGCARCLRLRKQLRDAEEREALLIAGIDNLAHDRRKIQRALTVERRERKKHDDTNGKTRKAK